MSQDRAERARATWRRQSATPRFIRDTRCFIARPIRCSTNWRSPSPTGRAANIASLATVPLLIDDFGMRRLPHTAAEDLLEIIMRRYERFSTLLTSNRPVEDWGKLLGDVAAASAMLDRLLHHGHTSSSAAQEAGVPKRRQNPEEEKLSHCEGSVRTALCLLSPLALAFA